MKEATKATVKVDPTRLLGYRLNAACAARKSGSAASTKLGLKAGNKIGGKVGRKPDRTPFVKLGAKVGRKTF